MDSLEIQTMASLQKGSPESSDPVLASLQSMQTADTLSLELKPFSTEESPLTSAFRYHGEKKERFNTLQYFTALNKAKNIASPDCEEFRKRRNLDRSDENAGLCDIFYVQRPSALSREE